MVDDAALRRNRLALLEDLRREMNRVADISKLADVACAKLAACTSRSPAVKLIILDRDGVINHDSAAVHQGPGGMEAHPRQPGGDRAPHPGGLPRRGRDQPVRHRPRALRHGHAERGQQQDAQDGEPGRRAHRGDLLLPGHRRVRFAVPQAEPRHVRRDRRAPRRRRSRTCRRSATACATCRPRRR